MVVGISYGISSEDGILQRNDDGTIKAVNSGSTTVWVYHKDIPNGPISLSVYVIDFPSKESLAVKNDPFSVTLADYELSKVDIYQRLVGNIETRERSTSPMSSILLRTPRVKVF